MGIRLFCLYGIQFYGGRVGFCFDRMVVNIYGDVDFLREVNWFLFACFFYRFVFRVVEFGDGLF